MILVLNEKELEELKGDKILNKSNLIAVVKKGRIDVIKNQYGFKGKYTNNDLVRIVRDTLRRMKERSV